MILRLLQYILGDTPKGEAKRAESAKLTLQPLRDSVKNGCHEIQLERIDVELQSAVQDIKNLSSNIVAKLESKAAAAKKAVTKRKPAQRSQRQH